MRAANDVRLGDRVIRGPTWKWGDQGGDTVGVVQHFCESGWACVFWGDDSVEVYRVKGSASYNACPHKEGWSDVIRVDTKWDRIDRRMEKNMAELNKLFERAGV